MGRLKLYILIFFIAVSIPLAFVIWQTYSGLEQEERGQLRFFTETMFDQMEKELADLVQVEENRAVDEYGYYLAVPEVKGESGVQLSPLSQLTYQEYILGYLQNNPDGSFQTPLVADLSSVSTKQQPLVGQIKNANQIFNRKKISIVQPTPKSVVALDNRAEQESKKDSFSERYLSRSKIAPSKSYLGKKKQRVEEITAEQAMNVAPQDARLRQYTYEQRKVEAEAKTPVTVGSARISEYDADDKQSAQYESSLADEVAESQVKEQEGNVPVLQQGFQVEVAPFQSVSLSDEQVYIFRRIAINNQIYRQGFILLVEPLFRNLIAEHFAEQPLAGFAALQMQRRDMDGQGHVVNAGVEVATSSFQTQRVFPPPFDFLSVTLQANNIPASPARRSLNVALVVLGVFMFAGLSAIYQSVRTIVAMSERRSQFVSSVTHELKTPLTNIRMYIEMLEQGIAATPEREQEYLGILGSESARLSGLINNVLELAKLEKKQRQFHMQVGHLDDVLAEVQTIMSQKLRMDGFSLNIQPIEAVELSYDRDVLIQILTNLIENSIKFGKQATRREITINADIIDDTVRITVSDTGPGIPSHALQKIFDDFYRVDNDLTRRTGGTGIGLALVKKFMTAMGGSVKASNNPESGCTITLLLPKEPPATHLA